MTSTNKWTHKVVKMQRGSKGEFFAHRAAATFASASEAMAYAERFAAEQRAAGVVGTRIVVIARSGAKKTIAAHNVNRGDVPAERANASAVYA